jgi:hypothetical protein
MIWQKLKLYGSMFMQFMHGQSGHLTMLLIIDGIFLQERNILVRHVCVLLYIHLKLEALFVES